MSRLRWTGIGAGLLLAMAASCRPASPTPPHPTPAQSRFDARRAFSDLEKQVRFGFRVPNTPGHVQCRDWIVRELSRLPGVQVQRQDFNQVIRGKKLSMTNIVAQINPTARRQVLLCAHWDTRPSADQEIDEEKRKRPIPGANDGASGVAVLLELARQFVAKPPAVGVQIVFFDGEDYGPGVEAMFLGARQYARKPLLPRPEYLILIDMIGDKDLTIFREENSQRLAPEVNERVWAAAKALNVTAFKDGKGYEVMDDHLPFQALGWPAIDLIDFDYAPWHTLDDSPDRCAPESLQAVGDVLTKVIYDEK